MRTLVAVLGGLVLTLSALAQASSSTPTISQLHAFSCNADFTSCPYGIEPTLAPVQLSNGNLYGVTWWAGQGNPNAGGTVWQVSTTGSASVLHTFMPTAGKFPLGENPVVGFLQGADHNLYGVSEQGGTSNQGVMYKLLPNGEFHVLQSFCTGTCTNIQGPIIRAKSGNFFGVQTGGEAIFRITPAGVYSVVHKLDSATEGRAGTMIQGKDGNFYGTGTIGTACEERGMAFKMSPSGEFTILATFGSFDVVSSGLVQALDGNFYGSISSSIFQMTPSGSVKTIYNLQAEDGSMVVELLQASDGNLWALSSNGGQNRTGEVFAISLQGSRVTGAAFSCATTGCSPTGMIQGRDGNFYGIAAQGGSAAGQNPYGTVFKIDAGLAPPTK